MSNQGIIQALIGVKHDDCPSLLGNKVHMADERLTERFQSSCLQSRSGIGDVYWG
jgi:hypothetical protein